MSLRFPRAPWLALVLAFVATVVSAPAAAQSRAAGLDPVLEARSRQLSGRSRVIVEFTGAPDVRAITRHRGVPGRQLTGAQVADVDNSALAALAAEPGVGRVTVDRPAFGTLERTAAASGARIAREEFGVTGKGVGVAVIDSGITSWHEDLYLTRGRAPRRSGQVVHFRDFTHERSANVWASEQPFDEYGHGTHVAGIIGGSGAASDGARTGVAPGASLIGLKVLDADGFGYVSDVIAAIDYAVSVKDAYNIRVMNVSVASGVFESYETDPLTQAARRAVNAGIVVVAAAGNLGTDANGAEQFGAVTSPGNAPWVLTVGAASHEGTPRRSDDTIARFSSRGPTRFDGAVKPDLVAHGVGTESLADPHSTLYSTYGDYLVGGTRRGGFKPYLSLSGTSMAAPVVAGTVALMLEVNPRLTPNAVKAILQYTAEERDGESFYAQGAGLLNTAGAVRMAGFFASPARGLAQPGDTIEGEWIEWSREIVWGNHRYAGGLILPGSSAFGLGVEWGAATTAAGRPVTWGVLADDSIIWGTAAGSSIIWGTVADQSIIWGTLADPSIIWGTLEDQSIIWGTLEDQSIIWGTLADQSIIWGTLEDQSIIWGTLEDQSIIWGTASGSSIIWGTAADPSIIWGTVADQSIIWGTANSDSSIIWGTGVADQTLWPAAQPVDNRRRTLSARH